MSFRIEEKIPASFTESLSIIEDLSTDGLVELFPERKIQSVYFDTPTFSILDDSEEGCLPRRKVRIRHYPDDRAITYKLETKISSVEGRFKEVKTITAVDKTNLCKLGLLDNTYGCLYPTVIVTYIRQYFSCRDVRITLDRDITYEAFSGGIPVQHEPYHVVEIKAPAHTRQDELLDIIPLPRRRFSKYSNAANYIRRYQPN